MASFMIDVDNLPLATWASPKTLPSPKLRLQWFIKSWPYVELDGRVFHEVRFGDCNEVIFSDWETGEIVVVDHDILSHTVKPACCNVRFAHVVTPMPSVEDVKRVFPNNSLCEARIQDLRDYGSTGKATAS